MEITANGNLQKGKIERILTRLRKIYLVLVILDCITLPFALIDFDQSNFRLIGESAISLVINLGAYIGLRRRRSWVIPLVLVTSAFGCFVNFCVIINPADDALALAVKILRSLLLFFYGYQLSFFPKRQVRLFFGAKGQVLF